MMVTISDSHLRLLNDPGVGYLGTVRASGGIQVNPMWFRLNEGVIEFTHTTSRAKFHNLAQNPSMSLCVTAREDPYKFVELRGQLIRVEDDPTGAFYQVLARRYGQVDPPAPPDSHLRVILVMSIESVHHN